MKLNLKNPIVFDLETTGVDPPKPDRRNIARKSNARQPETKTRRLNPEMHSRSGIGHHHIYDQDVADCPTFR